MTVFHDSRDNFYRAPFGAVPFGEKITLRLKVVDPSKYVDCKLVLWEDSEKKAPLDMALIKNENNEYIYEVTFQAPKKKTIIWYHFLLENIDGRLFYGEKDGQCGGEGVLTDGAPKSYQITIYEKDKTPAWYKEGIAYQIFPDRFFRGSDFEERVENTHKENADKNRHKYIVDEKDWGKAPFYRRENDGSVLSYDFYGGTLKGIEEKIEYLKNLGVSILYINPIFEARSNHRYDTGDYKKIDSLLGDEKSLKSLIKACKKNGIRIVLDGVFSHQGADSIYFNKYNNYDSIGAYNNKTSEYYDWYNFSDYPNEYASWWGVKDLPEVNELNDNYLDYICKNQDSVIKHYMRLGIAGFRLDVADELPDEFIKEVRLAENEVTKDNVLIGEVWEDATNKVSYDKNRKYLLGKSLNAVMNYPFKDNAILYMKGKISAYDFKEFMCMQYSNYPIEYFYSNLNLLGSHDTIRILTELSDADIEHIVSDKEKEDYIIPDDKYKLAVARLKVLSSLQYLIPGIPMIYYGDEVGVYGFDDPTNRKTYPWGHENEDLLNHYKKLSEIRLFSDAIRKGDFIIKNHGEHVVEVRRNYKDEAIILLINRAIFDNEKAEIQLDVEGAKAIDLYSDKTFDIKDNKLNIDINPLGFYILKIEKIDNK